MVATIPNVEIKCPVCGRLNWLDDHDDWTCIAAMTQAYEQLCPALETAKEALRNGLSVIGDMGCDNEDCPSNSRHVGWIEDDMGKALVAVTDALEAKP